MTSIPTLLLSSDLDPVASGIRSFIKLQGLIHDPNPVVYAKWLASEDELKATLATVADAMQRTAPMIGKRKHQGVDYDAPKEVKKDLLSFLTTTAAGQSATLMKRNLPMYYLVIEPTLDLFSKLTHQQMVEQALHITDTIAKMVNECTEYGTYQDALAAQAYVRELIHEREERANNAKMAKRRSKKPQRDSMSALLLALGGGLEDDPDDLVL